MPTVEIRVAGVNVTADVVFATARFQAKTNGAVGEGYMRVRDDASTYSFTAGADWLVLVDGSAAWRGFVMTVRRVYIAPAMDVAESGLQRFIDLYGPDGNVLLTRRVVEKASSPATVEGTQFAANTADTTAITDLLANWLDLSADSIDTSTGVTHVGNLDPAQKTRAWSGGWYWNNAMDTIAMLPGAIYYLRPESGSPHYTLVYCDVDTPTSPFGLSDQPNGSTTLGYRQVEITSDGTGLVTDEMAWGFGYGSQVPVFKRITDATALATHGRWQDGRQAFGVYKQATIDRIANSVVYGSPTNHRGAKDDRMAVDLVTYHPGLLAGHVVAFDSQVWGYSDTIPVRQSELTFDAPDSPKWHLLLSHAIDAPWGFFDQFWPKIPGFTFPVPHLPGTPSLPAGGCGPSVCGITDSFTRTLVSGWGTSDSSWPWHDEDLAPGTASVDGSHGDLSVPSGNECLMWLGRSDANLWPYPLGMRDVTVRAQNTFVSSGYLVLWLFSDNPTWINAYVEADFYTDGTLNFYDSHGDSVTTTLAWGSWVETMARIVSNGSSADLYVWRATDPPPSSPTLSLDASAWIGPYGWSNWNGVGVGAFNSGGGTLTAAWDSVDIVGLDRCTAVQFDDFNRTVAASSWGTADPSGSVWTTQGPGTATFDVVPGAGRIDQMDPGTVPNQHGSVYVYGSDTTKGWAGDFDMLAQFTISQVPDASHSGTLASWGVSLSKTVPLSGAFDQGIVMSKRDQFNGNADTIQFIPSTGSPTVATHTWTVPAVYWLRWVKTGTSHQIRVWNDGTPEPSTWDITATDAAITPLAFFVYQQQPFTRVFTTDPNATLFLYYTLIDFRYAGQPCYYSGGTPVFGGPGGFAISPTGWGCETPVASSSTVYATSVPFAAGSVLAWVAGVLKRPGTDYTEDSGLQSITFSSAPSGAVRVCYLSMAPA